MGSRNSKVHNRNVEANLVRGDIIKVRGNGRNSYYVYGGNSDLIFPLNENTRDQFDFPFSEATLRSAISFDKACGDSRCDLSSEQEWIDETEGKNITVETYNRNVLRTLFPGDIVKMKCHNMLYIGNGRVIHLIKGNTCSTHPERNNRHQESLRDVPSGFGLVVMDAFLALTKTYKAYKSNRRDMHGLKVQTIVKKATREVGYCSKFNLFTQNCKHFVEDMKYGFQVNYGKVRRYNIRNDPSELVNEMSSNEENEVDQSDIEMTNMSENDVDTFDTISIE